jgi:hypothetical protein
LNHITIYLPSTLFSCIFFEVIGPYGPIWTRRRSRIVFGNFSLHCGMRILLRGQACRLLYQI